MVIENYDLKFKAPITLTQALYESATFLRSCCQRKGSAGSGANSGAEIRHTKAIWPPSRVALGVSESNPARDVRGLCGYPERGLCGAAYGLLICGSGRKTLTADGHIAQACQELGSIQQSAAAEHDYMMSRVRRKRHGTRRRSRVELAGQIWHHEQRARCVVVLASNGRLRDWRWMGFYERNSQ